MSFTIDHTDLIRALLYIGVYLWIVLFFVKLLPNWIAELIVRVAKKKSKMEKEESK